MRGYLGIVRCMWLTERGIWDFAFPKHSRSVNPYSLGRLQAVSCEHWQSVLSVFCCFSVSSRLSTQGHMVLSDWVPPEAQPQPTALSGVLLGLIAFHNCCLFCKRTMCTLPCDPQCLSLEDGCCPPRCWIWPWDLHWPKDYDMCIHLCVWNVMCVCTYVCKKCVYAYVCMFEGRYVYMYVCMKCVCANAYMNCDEFVYIHRYEMWCVCTYACMKCDVSMCIHRYECDVCMYICMHELWWACVHMHVWNTVCVCTYISMKCDVCACVCVYKMWHMYQMWCVCKCLYEVWCLPHEGSNSESHCLCCTLFDFCQLWDQERACSHLSNGYNGKTETALNPSHEVEKQELVHTASGSVTRYNHFGKQPGSSK